MKNSKIFTIFFYLFFFSYDIMIMGVNMKYKVLLIFLLSFIFFTPVVINAKTIDTNSRTIAVKLENTGDSFNFNDSDYDNPQDCNSIFGSTNDPDSVAWLIQKALDIVKVLGPVLVLLLSSIDFLKVSFSGDEKAMKDAQRKLGIRLLLAISLLLLPFLVQWILEFFKITSSTCGIK